MFNWTKANYRFCLNINLSEIALTLGYNSATNINSLKEIEKHLYETKNGLHMIVLDVNSPDPDINLPRPIRTPEQTKIEFMKYFPVSRNPWRT